jgi:NADH-quinone oxidoreductase subunit N
MTAGALGDKREIGAFAGLFRRRPLTALAAGVCIMSLGGIPPTGGFIAKFGIFEALLARGWIIPAAAAAIASAVTLLYCARLIDILFVRADPAVVPRARVSPLMSACALAAAMGCLYLGVAGGDIQASLTRAALALHGGAS